MSKEIQQIIEQTDSLAAGEKAILATVVDVVGSGYRRPGARMLIDREGYSVGTVSGGCLEADVLERAKRVLEAGEATVITYDTTRDENSVFGLGMGCRGVVRILLEPIEKDHILTRIFQSLFDYRRRHSMATVISSSRAAIGGRIFYSAIEQFDFENLPRDVKETKELINDLIEFFRANRPPEIRHYEIGADVFEIFFENLNPPLNLLLFGAGFDALPLVKFAKELGWRVCVVDHRALYANHERLPEADELVVGNAADLDESFFNIENSAGVVMTHNYERDREILRRLLRSDCRYVGALGPRKRTEKLLEEIGESFNYWQLEKLHAPVGLDIGSETPEEIALAVVAEIKARLANRRGGFLRDKNKPIHD